MLPDSYYQQLISERCWTIYFDYKNKKLINFPHHLHDEKGRICSFSGDIADFIKYILRIEI